MRRVIFAVLALAIGCYAFPLSAQQDQELANAINAVGAQESELIKAKDAAGTAALFTADAIIVILAPKLAVKPGREAIQKHAQSLIDAGLINISFVTQQVEARGSDAAWAVGTYTLTLKDKTLDGNWVRVFKRENGAWKIAMESVARAAPVEGSPPAVSSK